MSFCFHILYGSIRRARIILDILYKGNNAHKEDETEEKHQ